VLARFSSNCIDLLVPGLSELAASGNLWVDNGEGRPSIDQSSNSHVGKFKTHCSSFIDLEPSRADQYFDMWPLLK